MYLAFCKLGGPDAITTGNVNSGPWGSRVFKSDLLTGDRLSWGIEWGTNLSIVQGSRVVTVSNSVQDFKANNIKVGDPIFLTDLATPFKSTISSIDSRYQLTMAGPAPVTDSAVQFWVGSNWFDAEPDDNDFIIQLGEIGDKLVIFKKFSLYTYNEVSLQPIRNSPGTTSPKSVVNLGDYVYYFHGSNANNRKTGIYLFDGNRSTKISSALQPYIDGIDPDKYDDVVAWSEGNRIRMFVRNISNSIRDISVTNAVLTYDTDGGQWSVDPIADVITASGRYIEGGSEKYFLGNNSGEVFEAQKGNGHGSDNIRFSIETGDMFPAGTSIINKFTRIQVESRAGRGIQVAYKLLGTPRRRDDQWRGIGDLEEDFQELFIPASHCNSRGINLRFSDLDGNLNNFAIRKLSVFYVPKNVRSKI